MTPGLMILKLSEGMTTSFFIFSLTLVFSLPLGLGVALIRMSPNHVLRSLTRGYISVMRGTPLMLQLLVVYFSPYYLLMFWLRSPAANAFDASVSRRIGFRIPLDIRTPRKITSAAPDNPASATAFVIALDRSSTLRTSTKQDGRLPAEPQVGAFSRRRTCRRRISALRTKR